jgi:2-oxoacid:acceptor oxidoreductase gamma subunit (pyruvate/2-ketoisovalerate family)
VARPIASAGTIHELREVRLVGRGGHGIVTAGELLGRAAVAEGRDAQSIPTFGPERRGALCSCTLRVSDEPIRLKCGSTRPDVLLVLDPTIWRQAPVTFGLREGAQLVFNVAVTPDEVVPDLHVDIERFELFTVDATGIALEFLKRPITNTAMMGALAGATGLVRLDSVERVLADRFGEAADRNIAAARAGAARLRKLGG